MKEKISKKPVKLFIYSIFLLVGMTLIVIRCFYGIDFDDELAYISVVKKMMEGQWVIINDWNAPTLLSSWLTYQMIRFTGIFQLESIVLAFRCIYILFQCMVSLFLFIWLRKEKWCPIAILVYLFSTPYNINTLSYNTLSVGFMMLVCGYAASRSCWRIREYMLLGVLFSFCVLSNPYVILIYLLYILLVIYFAIRKKTNNDDLTIFGFSYITLGAFLIFIVFMVSMLAHGSIKDYIANGMLLLNDVEHSSDVNLLMQIVEAVYQVFRVYWRVAIPMVIITGVTLVSSKAREYKTTLLIISLFFTAYGIIRFSFIYGSVYPNLMLVALNFIGIEIYLLIEDKPKKIFWNWFILGIIYAICIHVGTNTGILSGSAAFVVPSVACILLLFQLGSELSREIRVQKIANFLLYLFIALEIGCVYWLRINYVWADGNLESMKYQIKEGPCKYLYTTEERFMKYNEMIDLVEDTGVIEDDKVLFMPMRPLYYLETKGQYASPYTKRFLVNFTEVASYFNQNKDMIPNVVVVSNDGELEELEEMEKVFTWFKSKGYQETSESNFRKLEKK